LATKYNKCQKRRIEMLIWKLYNWISMLCPPENVDFWAQNSPVFTWYV